MTAILAIAGVMCIAVAVPAQQPPPAPPLSAVGSAGPAPPESPAPRPGRSATTRPQTVGPVLQASAPRTLAIPAIGVRSALLRLGQSADGSMEVPPPGRHYNEAGWYRYSPTPGSLGPAVVAGHVDSAADGPSVFFRLGSLRPKDTILVARADGSTAIFAVDEVRRFSKGGFPTRLVYGNTDHAALRLITCGGTFDRRSGHYRDNIVVLASLVRSSGGAGPLVRPAAASSVW